MSAWSIGATSRPAVTAELTADNNGVKSFVDKLVVWIPGDVVSLYVAGVTALGVNSPQLWFLILIILATPAVVLLGNHSLDRAKRQSHIGMRAVLATVAAAIWTLAVPGSGWQAIAFFKDNAPAVAVVAGLAGLLFGLLASSVIPEERSPDPPAPPAPQPPDA